MSLATPYPPNHTGSIWYGFIAYPHPETGERQEWFSPKFDNYDDAANATIVEWETHHEANARDNRDAYDTCVYEQMPTVRRP